MAQLTSKRMKELAFLAGVFEGEGCATHTRDSRTKEITGRFRLSVSMTDEDVVKRFYNFFRVGRLGGPYETGHKPRYTWTVDTQDDAASVAYMLYPFLGIRRQERLFGLIFIWRNTPIVQRHRAKCGTHSGYMSHIQWRKTEVCEPCHTAYRIYCDEYNRKRREQRKATKLA